ncbi:hypothetical protein EUTSA_v10029125mg [Eutrema salsugineum]|uniref:PGG domain-containing protein n=1 Tax=Eutrema salsugineum TaxID=72664 RepID=V4L7W4_EUTSA|nr:hypothetical protein EUTSA_v10029125mg [Eutrema salsugineum]
MSIVVDVTRVSDMVAQDANLSGRSGTSTHDANIYEKFKKAAQDGDIERLYQLIAEDPDLLGHFDKVPLCETPLHIAAERGQTHFAMELMTFKPLLASKLNVAGFSPMHLALQNNHIRMVLYGWVKRENRKEILDWKDEDGNTAFHIAASMNQTEVMKLLRKTVKVKAKNLDGKTAMDILQSHQSPCFLKARRILHSAKERLLGHSTTTLAGYLSKNLTFIERHNNLLGLSNLSMTGDMSLNTSNRYDAILVVAVLIATATYQAGLSPPGGFWQESSNPANHSDPNFHVAGQMTMDFDVSLFFNVLNGFAFLSSLYVIIILIIGLPLWKFIYGSTGALSTAMIASYRTILPHSNGQLEDISTVVFAFGFPSIIVIMLFVTVMAFIVDKYRRHRVDFPASCFSSLYVLCINLVDMLK